MKENLKNPKISVIMPNYNCEKYIAEAIESILIQTFTDFEFIIIDDGSSDNSWNIIQEYVKKDHRIIAIKNEENLKICKTLNKWIDLARWEYIARMDSDDISIVDRFEKQVQFLDKNLDVWIVGWTMEIMDENWNVYSQRKYNLNDAEIRKKLFRYSPFCHATTMYRKSIISKIGGYNIFLHDAEDYDLYFRIWKISNFSNITAVLYKMRVNKNSVTYKNTKRMELLTLFIRKKAVYEYWYKMNFWDKIYWVLQYLSIYIIPWKFKIWLFNLIRNK